MPVECINWHKTDLWWVSSVSSRERSVDLFQSYMSFRGTDRCTEIKVSMGVRSFACLARYSRSESLRRSSLLVTDPHFSWTDPRHSTLSRLSLHLSAHRSRLHQSLPSNSRGLSAAVLVGRLWTTRSSLSIDYSCSLYRHLHALSHLLEHLSRIPSSMFQSLRQTAMDLVALRSQRHFAQRSRLSYLCLRSVSRPGLALSNSSSSDSRRSSNTALHASRDQYDSFARAVRWDHGCSDQQSATECPSQWGANGETSVVDHRSQSSSFRSSDQLLHYLHTGLTRLHHLQRCLSVQQWVSERLFLRLSTRRQSVFLSSRSVLQLDADGADWTSQSRSATSLPGKHPVSFNLNNHRDDLPHRFRVCSLVVYLWTPCVNPLWNVSTINRASTPCSFDRRPFDPRLWISLPLASLAMQRSVRCSTILSSSSLGKTRRTSLLTSPPVDRHRYPTATTLDSIWAGSSPRVSVLSGVWWSSGSWWHQHWFESGIDARPRVDQNKQKSKCSPSVRQEGHWRKVSEVCLNRMKVAIFVSVIVPHLHRTIYNFNIFSSDKPEEERVGILATRLYLILVLIGLLALGFYTSLVMRTQIRTIADPSLGQFEELNSLHASTLSCPCSRFSMSYARIMSLAPRYHQICSSQFLDKYWLSYFGRMEKDANKVDFLALDFRIIGSSFFDLMRIFCQTSNETVHDAMRVFRSTRLATVNALSRTQFHLETSARLDQFQKQTIATFLDLIDLIRSAIQTNDLVTELWTSAGPSSRFDNDTSKWSLRFRARNFYTNSCSCALSNQCTRPVGFYLQEDNIYSEPNITVPGLVIGCYAIDSFLFSTLECLFDRQCLQLIIDSYEFDAVDLVHPLDIRAVRIAPLQNNHSRFSPRTPMETIVSQLFIEDWSTSNNFTAYYNRCEPKQCTYSVRQRFDTAYMVAAMLGFYGGLSAILEIMLPPLVKLVRSRWLKRRPRQPKAAANTVTGISERVTPIDAVAPCPEPKSLVRKVRSLNLFPERKTAAEELLATRIYLLLFALCLIAAFLYAGPLSSETKTIVTKTPTSTMVNDLHARNLSTLSCPCSKAAVNYSTFLSVTPHFHPICSSEFVLPALWADLFEKNDNVSLELSAHYRLLASLCERAYRTIENAQTLFTTREIISKETLTEPSFNHQIHAFLVGFIADLPADFRRKLSFTINSFSVNQLLNRFTSNWQVSFTGEDEKFIIATHPRRFPASNCSCATSSKCFEELAPNVFSGCLPFDGFRRSTLHNLSISQLTDQLFVTHWYNTSNYTAYFETCRPLECQYTISDRQNLIYIFTTVLGLYGGKEPRASCRHCNRVCILIDLGLTYGLRLIVDRALYIYRLWKYNPEQWSNLTIVTTVSAFLSFSRLSPRA